MLSFLVGLFSLRVKAIFFAMITLAVASFFPILASQLSDITGGEDGITFKVPESAADRAIAGRTTWYSAWRWRCSSSLLRDRQFAVRPGAAGDPRERFPRRGARLPHRDLPHHRQLPAARRCATLAGALYALWLRYTGPNTTLDFDIMIDILLMVVIGGMGTMYGAVIGATMFVVAQNYLQDLMKAFSGAMKGVPLLPELFHPDRWLLWLGVLFVLSVYYFPPASSASCAQGRRNELAVPTTWNAKAGRSTTREWGAEHPATVIAWHGLARTGRDMDDIAAHLAPRYRVICPDTIGRGLSQWSPAPEKEYCLAFYARLAVSLLDQLGIRELHWLGTSMGGAIGIRLAAGALKGRIRRLVAQRHRARSWAKRRWSASAAMPAIRRSSTA